MIFNTHSHINDKMSQIPNILKKCQEANVSDIAVIGYNYNSSLNALNAAKTYKNIYAICGLQPCEINDFNGDFTDFEKIFVDKDCIAIGEIGLDYYYGKENKDLQLLYFEKQLQIAIKLNKPVVIHCREAHEDTFNLLSKYHKDLKGIVLHCYTGSVEMMKRYLSINAYISFSGVVTFKNAKTVKDVAKECPLDRLLVETDDPYLTPSPFRGKENDPSYVTYVVEEISKLKGLSSEIIANASYENAKKVFNL